MMMRDRKEAYREGDRVPLRIILQNVLNHVENLEKKKNEGDDCFEKEFQELKQFTENLKSQSEYSSSEGEKDVNRKKNRYKDILPYDFCRVVLSDYGGVPGSDYINASYIKGASGSSAYIACQGPLPHTVADFWRMVVECEVQVIVMACNEKESGKHKCENYWVEEEGEEKQFGKVKIQLIKARQVCPDFLVRTMQIFYTTDQGKTEDRTLCQFHYSAWPDHGVPPLVRPLLDMVRLVRDCQASETLPVLVHCSAGCGRTGTICAIDFVWGLLRSGKLTPSFGLYPLVREMRRQRIAMVQTKEQYMLVHRAVKELFQEQLKIINSHPYANVDQEGLPLAKEDPVYASLDSIRSEEKSDQKEKEGSEASISDTEPLPVLDMAPPLPQKKRHRMAAPSKLEKEVENLHQKHRVFHSKDMDEAKQTELPKIVDIPPIAMSTPVIKPRVIEASPLHSSNESVEIASASSGSLPKSRQRLLNKVFGRGSPSPDKHSLEESPKANSEPNSSRASPIRNALMRKPSIVKLKAFFEKSRPTSPTKSSAEKKPLLEVNGRLKSATLPMPVSPPPVSTDVKVKSHSDSKGGRLAKSLLSVKRSKSMKVNWSVKPTIGSPSNARVERLEAANVYARSPSPYLGVEAGSKSVSVRKNDVTPVSKFDSPRVVPTNSSSESVRKRPTIPVKPSIPPRKLFPVFPEPKMKEVEPLSPTAMIRQKSVNMRETKIFTFPAKPEVTKEAMFAAVNPRAVKSKGSKSKPQKYANVHRINSQPLLVTNEKTFQPPKEIRKPDSPCPLIRSHSYTWHQPKESMKVYFESETWPPDSYSAVKPSSVDYGKVSVKPKKKTSPKVFKSELTKSISTGSVMDDSAVVFAKSNSNHSNYPVHRSQSVHLYERIGPLSTVKEPVKDVSHLYAKVIPRSKRVQQQQKEKNEAKRPQSLTLSEAQQVVQDCEDYLIRFSPTSTHSQEIVDLLGVRERRHSFRQAVAKEAKKNNGTRPKKPKEYESIWLDARMMDSKTPQVVDKACQTTDLPKEKAFNTVPPTHRPIMRGRPPSYQHPPPPKVIRDPLQKKEIQILLDELRVPPNISSKCNDKPVKTYEKLYVVPLSQSTQTLDVDHTPMKHTQPKVSAQRLPNQYEVLVTETSKYSPSKSNINPIYGKIKVSNGGDQKSREAIKRELMGERSPQKNKGNREKTKPGTSSRPMLFASRDDLDVKPQAPPRIKRNSSVAMMRHSLIETDSHGLTLSVWGQVMGAGGSAKEPIDSQGHGRQTKGQDQPPPGIDIDRVAHNMKDVGHSPAKHMKDVSHSPVKTVSPSSIVHKPHSPLVKSNSIASSSPSDNIQPVIPSTSNQTPSSPRPQRNALERFHSSIRLKLRQWTSPPQKVVTSNGERKETSPTTLSSPSESNHQKPDSRVPQRPLQSKHQYV